MVGKIGIVNNAGRLVLAAMATLLLLSGTAVAQLALSGNMPVAGTGIPFGATGLDSPGLSPAPTGTIGPTGNATMCSGVGSSSLGMTGTGAIYDGGGIGMGATSLGGSVTCDATSGSGPSSIAPPTSLPSLGGASPGAIPLGSFEINNAGVSPSVAVPAPSFSIPTTSSPPATIGAAMPCSISSSSMLSIGC
jgi:hypothetical protein